MQSNFRSVIVLKSLLLSIELTLMLVISNNYFSRNLRQLERNFLCIIQRSITLFQLDNVNNCKNVSLRQKAKAMYRRHSRGLEMTRLRRCPRGLCRRKRPCPSARTTFASSSGCSSPCVSGSHTSAIENKTINFHKTLF